jgi:hypothetical protein
MMLAIWMLLVPHSNHGHLCHAVMITVLKQTGPSLFWYLSWKASEASWQEQHTNKYQLMYGTLRHAYLPTASLLLVAA